MTRAIAMVHETDPKQEILSRVRGLIDDILPMTTEVICGIYVRPERTAGGIILPQDKGMRREDEYQGKVGLVLKMGPLAFTDDENHKWGDVKPKVGDWVLWRVGDTFPFSLGDAPCRFVDEGLIRAILPGPDIVY